MQIEERPRTAARPALRVYRSRPRSGGTEGNARLTGLTAAVLLVLLAVEGATLLHLQTFVSWHILVGFALVPVVALKVASTGYRMLRYYGRREEYVRLGPPKPLLRLVGPVVVLSTLGLFATGVALALLGPTRTIVLGLPVLGLHKASFAVWLAAMTVHVLAHIVRIPALTAPDVRGGGGVGGSRARLALVAGSIVAGAILAIAAAPLATPWVHWVNSWSY